MSKTSSCLCRRHCRCPLLPSPPIVFRFSSWHFSAASDVMKLINSDTHSCTHSLASFAILAVGGTAFFMIRETFAIFFGGGGGQTADKNEEDLRGRGGGEK